MVRALLEQLEAGDADPTGSLVYLAAQAIEIGEADLRAARRRAMLLLAAGGDPSRELFLDDRAVSGLADDLDEPARRVALEEGLAAVEAEAGGLQRVLASLDELRAEPELAWRWYALALLADELGDESL